MVERNLAKVVGHVDIQAVRDNTLYHGQEAVKVRIFHPDAYQVVQNCVSIAVLFGDINARHCQKRFTHLLHVRVILVLGENGAYLKGVGPVAASSTVQRSPTVLVLNIHSLRFG